MSMEIEINTQFAEALRMMEETDKNIFITGRAGTGKSTLLAYFRSITHKKIVVLAPTGVAAVNIAGQTIHSFFGFRPDITVEKVKDGAGKKSSSIFKNLDAIVIDEISMVRSDLLDCVDQFLRIHGKNRGAPCGGIQMIFVGDLYQIPPVVTGQEKQIFRDYYESEYFFDARAFHEMDFALLELEKIYRQTDPSFIEFLNRIRNKTITADDLQEINRKTFDDNRMLPEGVIYLTTTNAMAEKRNETELNRLQGRAHIFPAKIAGEVEEKYYPAADVLQLKKGAQVMLLNNDSKGRWINGTIGTITGIKRDALEVRLLDGSNHTVEPYTWGITRYYWDRKTGTVASETLGTFTQYPMRLAWAITIHKSQGKTFDHIAIDLGKGTFAPGQLYVALSRCRSLDGIYLKRKIKETDVWIDWKVIKFITNLQYRKSEKEIPIDEKVRLIEQAIENESSLEISYLKSEDEKSQRTITPSFVGDMEYMGKSFLGMRGYCHMRKAQRTFRVDRILKINDIVPPRSSGQQLSGNNNGQKKHHAWPEK